MNELKLLASPDLSEECFSQLKGKPFVAICYDENRKQKFFANHVSTEEAVFLLNRALHQILYHGDIVWEAEEEE